MVQACPTPSIAISVLAMVTLLPIVIGLLNVAVVRTTPLLVEVNAVMGAPAPFMSRCRRNCAAGYATFWAAVSEQTVEPGAARAPAIAVATACQSPGAGCRN